MTYKQKIYSAIDSILEEAMNDEGILSPSFERNGESVRLFDEFVDYLEGAKFISDYDIDEGTCFDCPSLTVGYISIAFITIDNELGHITVEWEIV